MEQPGRAPLDGFRCEVAVIGGGINGVAIARECARAGKRTLLLERHDFASGSTSRSTRIIHGGLRYLEHRELGLVRESLRERERLLRERPHLVRPLKFLLALSPGRRHSSLAIRAGLMLYQAMGGRRSPPGRAGVAELERLLDSGSEWAIFDYEDAQCEFPERLVAEWLIEGLASGLTARNHTEVLEVVTRDGVARGLRLRDQLTQQESLVEADWIINATGPWVDRVVRASGLDAPRLVGGVRGSHLLLPRFDGAPQAAVYSEGVDGRPVFVVPWNGQLLVGTTEVRDDGDPAAASPESAEIDHLFRSLKTLFPAAPEPESAQAFAGIRPLPHAPEAEPSAITRRHHWHDHAADGAAHLLSLVGGKLTTAAAVARECARRLGMPAEERCIFAAAPPADGVESALAQWSRLVAQVAGIPETSARALAEWHCHRALPIARLAATCERLREPLCPHSPHLVAEAVEAVQHECAVTLADILLRRAPVALGACWTEECSAAAARRVGAALGWDAARIASELETFEEERAQFLVRASRPLAERAA